MEIKKQNIRALQAIIAGGRVVVSMPPTQFGGVNNQNGLWKVTIENDSERTEYFVNLKWLNETLNMMGRPFSELPDPNCIIAEGVTVCSCY